MAKITRELHRKARGPVMNDEDWWRLVFDTEAKRLFVEHEWAYLDVRRGPAAIADNGSSEIELSEALAGEIPREAYSKLLSLIGTLFEDSHAK